MLIKMKELHQNIKLPFLPTTTQQKRRPFDLHQLITEFVAPLEKTLEPEGFYLSIRISPLLPRIFMGNPLLIKKLLDTIVQYGRNHLNEGGIVLDVSAEPDEEHSYKVGFTITVSGLGIPPQMMRSLFQPEKDDDDDEALAHVSSLHEANIICSSMGGAISIYNTHGFGTRYSVDINIEAIITEALSH